VSRDGLVFIGFGVVCKSRPEGEEEERMSRYTLQPKRNNMPLVETIHETWIDAPSKAAFQALAAAQGLSMRAALAQLIEQH
ncbi:hypothetical protein HMPREF0175_1517, partial [Bifidobacterium longum subsp. longum ATCC 55813]